MMNAGVAGRLSAYLIVLAVPYSITWLLWLLFRRSQKLASIVFTSLLLFMAVVMFGPKLAEIGKQARESEMNDQISNLADNAEWQRKFSEHIVRIAHSSGTCQNETDQKGAAETLISAASRKGLLEGITPPHSGRHDAVIRHLA